MRDLEHQAAVSLIHWWALFSRSKFDLEEKLLFAIPNGGARHIAVAMKLKAEGVRAGVSDYFLAVPVGKSHGLFIELKKGGKSISHGKPTQEQLEFGLIVQDQGYNFVIAHGFDEAKNAIENYLNQK